MPEHIVTAIQRRIAPQTHPLRGPLPIVPGDCGGPFHIAVGQLFPCRVVSGLVRACEEEARAAQREYVAWARPRLHGRLPKWCLGPVRGRDIDDHVRCAPEAQKGWPHSGQEKLSFRPFGIRRDVAIAHGAQGSPGQGLAIPLAQVAWVRVWALGLTHWVCRGVQDRESSRPAIKPQPPQQTPSCAPAPRSSCRVGRRRHPLGTSAKPILGGDFK